MSFLKSLISPVRNSLAASVVASTLNAALLILQYWLIADVANRVVFKGAGLQECGLGLLLALPIVVVRAFLVWLSETASIHAAVKIKSTLRQRLFQRMLDLGPVRLSGSRTGELAALISDGVESLEAYYARFLPAMFTAALVPTAILAVVAPNDWLSGIVLAVTAPMIPLFMILIGKGAEKLNQRQWAKLARLSARFLEAVQNLTVLKLFNASRREAELIARVSEDYRLATMSVLRVAFLSSLALEFFATVSIAIVAVFIGFRLLAGEMDFHNGLFVLLLAPEFYLPLRSLGAHYHARMEAVAVAGKMAEMLSSGPEKQDAVGECMFNGLSPPKVEFEDVHLIYPDGRRGLNGFSLILPSGQTTALVGPSGSGKSSVASLILRFVDPRQGRILIDGNPLGDLNVASWRSACAWVPQRPYLFQGTIADNLRLGAPLADDEALVEAARMMGAHDFISRFKDGYQHPIGEKGRGLSGGQARLLALTRAALKNAKLLILDEPTASLDAQSEYLVQNAVTKLSQGRTVLVIAHRLATVRGADQVVALNDGCVVERGRHGQLARLDGYYAAMLRAGEGFLVEDAT